MPAMVDGERVCLALSAVPDVDALRRRAQQLAVVADPTRLLLLAYLAGGGPLCVRDLAAALGMDESTVSHALRLLRAHDAVTVERQGRLALYRLNDGFLSDVLRLAMGPQAATPARSSRGARSGT